MVGAYKTIELFLYSFTLFSPSQTHHHLRIDNLIDEFDPYHHNINNDVVDEVRRDYNVPVLVEISEELYVVSIPEFKVQFVYQPKPTVELCVDY